MRLLLCMSLLLLAGCNGLTPQETVTELYRDQFRTKGDLYYDQSQAFFSASFREASAWNRLMCDRYAGTDMCGWDSGRMLFLDTQEVDPALNFETARFRTVVDADHTVHAYFNVYPSLPKHDPYYDRHLTYVMIPEGGRWVADDMCWQTGPGTMQCARAAMVTENAYLPEEGGAVFMQKQAGN